MSVHKVESVKSSRAFEPIETASIDELRALQWTRLIKALRHAYDNMPVYRAKCLAKGVHPDDLKQFSDLSLFPFVTKQDFRENYPFGMFAVPLDQVSRIHASSGTTGKPIVVGYTKSDLDLWANLVARTIYAAGGRPGDKVHVAYNYGLFTGGIGSHYGAERLGCTVIPVSGGQTQRQVQLIVDFDPDIMMVTPSYLLNITDEMDKLGVDASKLALRAAVVGAEPWTEAMRREINRRLHMQALDTYGLSEVIGPGRRAGMRGDRGWPNVMGRPFLSRDHRSGDGRGVARRIGGRTRPYMPHQRGAAGHAISHARPHPATAGHSPDDAPDRARHRPLRRHADHPRREHVPIADRGAGASHACLGPQLSDRSAARRTDGRGQRFRGDARARIRRSDRGRRQRPAAQDQDLRRRIRRHNHQAAGIACQVGGQGGAGD
jgi:hypothetical protein